MKLANGQLSQSLGIKYYTKHSLKLELKVRHTLGCTVPSNFIKDRFSSLFQNMMLGSFKSFFQLDHQVGQSPSY